MINLFQQWRKMSNLFILIYLIYFILIYLIYFILFILFNLFHHRQIFPAKHQD